jgi:hypothetical protein
MPDIFPPFELLYYNYFYLCKSAEHIIFDLVSLTSLLNRMFAEYVLILTLAIFLFLQKLACLEVMAKRRSSTTDWELK